MHVIAHALPASTPSMRMKGTTERGKRREVARCRRNAGRENRLSSMVGGTDASPKRAMTERWPSEATDGRFSDLSSSGGGNDPSSPDGDDI